MRYGWDKKQRQSEDVVSRNPDLLIGKVEIADFMACRWQSIEKRIKHGFPAVRAYGDSGRWEASKIAIQIYLLQQAGVLEQFIALHQAFSKGDV